MSNAIDTQLTTAVNVTAATAATINRSSELGAVLSE
jgi:hypothetical protein